MRNPGYSGRGAGITAAGRRRDDPAAARLPRLPALGLLVALIGSCATAVEPEAAGGHRLPGTEDARCRGKSVLSFSPDGRWLLYESRWGDALHPVFVFFDPVREERHATSLSPEAADLSREGRGPTLPACWSADSTIAFFPGHGTWFVASTDDGAFQLQPVAEPDCPHPRDEPAPTGAQVKQDSPEELRIVGQSGGVLAEHATRDWAADRIEATHLRRSPEGRWLSYVLTEYRGSFTTPSRGYVLSLTPNGGEPPRLLAAPVFGPLEWAPTGELYGCTGRPDAPRPEPRILRWTP